MKQTIYCVEHKGLWAEFSVIDDDCAGFGTYFLPRKKLEELFIERYGEHKCVPDCPYHIGFPCNQITLEKAVELKVQYTESKRDVIEHLTEMKCPDLLEMTKLVNKLWKQKTTNK